MLDFNPLGVRRIWLLRQFPMLAGAALGDLALLSENVIEASYAAGASVAVAGVVPEAVQLIVDGEIAMAGRTWGAHEAFGLLELLAGRPLAAQAIATRRTRTLQLLASDLGDVLEEGFGVLRGTLHELATRARWLARGRATPIVIPEPRPLGLVDRLLVLRQLSPFGSARLDALGALAHAAEEVAFGPGAVLARAGDRAETAHVILEGDVRATASDLAPALFAPGSLVGGIEVVGELPHARTFEAGTPVRTLAVSSRAVFDVIEDHTELGLAILSSFASALL